MEIILKQDVAKLGHKDDIITVKNGYGRNFLIPKKLGIIASPSAKKNHAEKLRQQSHKEEQLRKDAEALAATLSKLELKIGAKTSTTGKIFGSVNTIQIAEVLNGKGYEIDRKNISMNEEAVKEVGSYTASIKLYKDIKTEISFEVCAE
ncbi:MAG: 50S ribosomal protein L9 [Bacteroidetes bacterium]|jgi:large subunit ribosomal protein L9|nr:50S ribosomal protein L9 [Bacteroidota bacterium]MBT3748059.1 50S ribosomal protein L9 [Bacteroidota bacterium]MBT4399325.1 50S ribosomal protein L9 [Bacteroidota bacterium]MBT4410804.1 50S ribosomal protein L9 [Bacteroidota bacterium]MBT5427461.1 50S ribosomal protein L9 [Bacteroidota bacterium]